jgi:hypothetical protein
VSSVFKQDYLSEILWGTPVIRKNSVPREISANVRDRSESDPAGATESVIGPAVIAYSPET